MPGDNTILSVNNLQVTFTGDRTFTAVNNISFEIGKGKTLAIVGESGSGKSLTALALMALLPKNALLQGDINLRMPGSELPVTQADLPSLRGAAVGMVFQEPMSSLNPVMKIGRQLTEAILVHQAIPAASGKQLAIEWLRKVQLPEPDVIYHRYPHQLSGGQKQRVMIAMAMCNHPALLIADEPTTALDVTVQQEIIRLMHYLQQEHQSAMIFITHDLSLAASIADEVLVLYRGEMVEYGPAEQVLKTPQHAYTKALLACKPSPEHKGRRLPSVADFLENNDWKVPTITEIPALIAGDKAPILQVNNLRVWFAANKNFFGAPSSFFKAVDDISFTLYRGEVLGLVGESGSGKSTVSRSLVGLLPATGGEILFDGKDLTKISLREWTGVRRQIQMIFQDPYSSLNPRMTIGDMLAEPLTTHRIVPQNEIERGVSRLLDLVQLPAGSGHRYAHQFSGGQRQRIGIARALAVRPELLICDESVSALDVSIQAQILNLLKDLQHEFQLTYLFISHDLSVVHYFSDRVMVMKAGKIVESGDADQILRSPQNEYTRRLVEAVPGESQQL
jgi:peptide/nickel transport system ATP-binding protein